MAAAEICQVVDLGKNKRKRHGKMMNSMCERVLPPLVFYGLCTYISFVVDSVCSCGEINALGSGQGASHV